MNNNSSPRYTLSILLLFLLTLEITGCNAAPTMNATEILSTPSIKPTPTELETIRYNENIKFRGIAHEPIPDRRYYDLLANDYGVNSIAITHWIEIGFDKGGVFDYARTNPQDTLDAIDAAHQAGLHVFLQLYPEFFKQSYWEETGEIGPYNNHSPAIDPLTGELMPAELERGPMPDLNEFTKAYNEIVMKWARLAEEHEVELFAPSCEMNLFLGWENSAMWWQDILIPLRGTYTGELVQKGEISWEKYGHENGDLSYFDHFKGWDYVNTDFLGEKETPEEYRELIHQTMGYLQELKQRFGAKGIILTEIGTPEDSEMYKKKATSSHEVRIAYWSILFEETQGLIDGYYFWPWDGQEPPENNSEKFNSGYSILALNYFDTPKDQIQAFLKIHEAIRDMDEIHYYWKNTAEDPLGITNLELEINTLKGAYLKGEDYPGILANAEELVQRISDTLALVIPYSDIVNVHDWLKSTGQDDLWKGETFDPLMQKIEEETQNGSPASALLYTNEARQLLGFYYADAEGDAPAGVQDLKSVYITIEDNRLIVLFAVYGDATQGSYSVEADTNMDGERDVIWFLKCQKNSASAIRFSGGGVINANPPDRIFCDPKVARLEVAGVNTPVSIRPTSDIPQQDGNPQFDEIIMQRVTLE
jgi:hypothetical protein